MDILTGQRRGAVNVEYIILIVAGALAVVLGLGVLGDAINNKHIAVADALSRGSEQVASAFTSTPVISSDNNDGTIDIIGSNVGAPPYELRRDGVMVDVSNEPAFSDVPCISGVWNIVDSGDNTSSQVNIAEVVDAPELDLPPAAADIERGIVIADSFGFTIRWTRLERDMAEIYHHQVFALVDVDDDGLMQATDYVFCAYIEDVLSDPSIISSSGIYAYAPSVSSGDAIGGNGAYEYNTFVTQVPAPSLVSNLSNNDLTLSMRVSRADLGMAPSQPFRVRLSSYSEVTSNCDALDPIVVQ